MEVILVTETPEAEKVIERMGRLAHRSEIADANDFIRQLIKWKHESVLEHASATVEVAGVSRALTHQLVRHRLVSFTQESQRYCSYEDGFGYVVPPSIALRPLEAEAFRKMMVDIQNLYQGLILNGVPPEDARFVLPNACHTKIGITANFRQWRHMFRLRCEKYAQWEIRQMFKNILMLMNGYHPACFGDIADLYLGVE